MTEEHTARVGHEIDWPDAYRERIKETHPDHAEDGDHDASRQVQEAKEVLLQ